MCFETFDLALNFVFNLIFKESLIFAKMYRKENVAVARIKTDYRNV